MVKFYYKSILFSLCLDFNMSNICHKRLQCISLPGLHILLSYFCLREHCYFDRCCYPCCERWFLFVSALHLNSSSPAHSLSYYCIYLWGRPLLKGVLKIVSIYCYSIIFYKFFQPTKTYNQLIDV